MRHNLMNQRNVKNLNDKNPLNFSLSKIRLIDDFS